MIYSIIAGLIPIIEEIAKQIPVWLLAWRKLSPRAGLLVGALGGAGFATNREPDDHYSYGRNRAMAVSNPWPFWGRVDAHLHRRHWWLGANLSHAR